MRICFTSDLHGDLRLYEQLEELLRAEMPDLLILGGDLLPDGDPQDPLGTQVAFLEQDFLPRVALWQAANPRLSVAWLSANHEWRCTDKVVQAHERASRITRLDHCRLRSHRGVALLGYGAAPPTPHWVKDFERLDMPGDPIPDVKGLVWDSARRCVRPVDPEEHFSSQPTMDQELQQAPNASGPWILVAHTPPHDTHLDRVEKSSQPIGSRAIRRFIQERQPLCALHGHVHESPMVSGRYVDRLGRTLCVNPGQDRCRLHAVLLDSEDPAGTLRHTVFR